VEEGEVWVDEEVKGRVRHGERSPTLLICYDELLVEEKRMGGLRRFMMGEKLCYSQVDEPT